MGDADATLLAAAEAALAHRPGTLGLALSGGSDSTAMLHLMARAAPGAGVRLRAVTVNHGLRAEAADEAAEVGRICAAFGVPHDILRWEHGEIRGNLMDRARRARYALIADWARRSGVGFVALAHTATDQAETLLMGLARGAGLDGLSGMRGRFDEGDVTFVRPLLSIGRDDLRAYLQRHGVQWIDDPTNADEHYLRTRARKALKALAPLGITEARLSGTAQHLAQAQAALKNAARSAAREVVRESAGALWLGRDRFCALDPEMQRRVLNHCLAWLTHDAYPPRGADIQRLVQAIARPSGATLAGCRLLTRGEHVLIVREAKAAGGPVPFGEVWDGRWIVRGPAQPADEVRALGAGGLARCKGWRQAGQPREVLVVTPGLWRGEELVAAPVLGGGGGWSASIGQSFDQFIISH